MVRSLPVFACVALALCGCGGGTESAGAPNPGNSTPPSTPATPAPVTNPPVVVGNRPPVVQGFAPDRRFVIGTAYSFDLSLAGVTVTDADGDQLTWRIWIDSLNSLTPYPPAGLTLTGTVLAGTPSQAGVWAFNVYASDGKAAEVTYRVTVRVERNTAPTLAKAIPPQLVPVGSQFQFDPTQALSTFTDPDGDPLTYSVSVIGDKAGQAVSGLNVAGRFAAPGAVEVTVTARDPYGGQTSHSFMLAAPASESASPSLPATPYVYRDEELPLPYFFRSRPASNPTTNAGGALGRVLFYDKRLSIANTIACASCHEQQKGFATSNRFDAGVVGIPMKRNSMSLANARYSAVGAYFWDMHAPQTPALPGLQAVVMHPLESHLELGMTPELLVSKLSAVSFYPPLFAQAFGTAEITPARIREALAQFVQSIISYTTKHDVAYNPMVNQPVDPAAVFNLQEMQGFELFRTNCSICHRLTAHTNDWQANNGLDLAPDDVGSTVPFSRGGIGVFRAPSLRNVARSAPYMHDGRFATLRQVIDHYDSGVKDSSDVDGALWSWGTGPRRLNLTEADKVALEVYLNLLTDEAMLADPKFSDPFP